MVQALAARKITTPFPIQALAVPEALAGRDVLAKSPTGSGKTLAFGLPLVERTTGVSESPAALVLFPATLDGDVGELARAYTHDPVRLEASLPSQGAEGVVEHTFVGVTADGKLDALITELESERGLALVFVRTKRGADRLAHKLSR